MGLPDTREETVTSASQIRASLLNLIQDMVVGRRHAEMEFPLDASSFVSTVGATFAGGGDESVVSDLRWEFHNPGSYVRHPMHYLPPGTTLTTIEWTHDAGPDGMTFFLGRRPKSGAVHEVIQGPDAAVGVGKASTIITYNHVMAAGYWYYVFARGFDGGKLYGATLKAKK
jgi:hypothetical protein